ncbi:MAG TPA: hypothetical protein DEQ20_11185 [Desulfobulbaceae bacterium]|nr:hypothetical protein [Desulfobulbaceae bacterium]
MRFLKKLFAKKEQKTVALSEKDVTNKMAPDPDTKEVVSMVTDWPPDLSFERLASINIRLVVSKLKAYEAMAHPRDATTARMGVPLIYPQYDAAGRRQGIPHEDQKICSAQHVNLQNTVSMP